MTLPLTEKQEQLWRFVRSCERSPTYREMMRALGYKSKSSINRLVVSLKKRGFVDYIPGSARSLVALDSAPSITTAALMAELDRRGLGVVLLPLHGRIS